MSVHPQETPFGNRHRRRVDYDRKHIESPTQKTFGIQDTPRGVSSLVKPCYNSTCIHRMFIDKVLLITGGTGS
uniref:hypothetical protein n=1 Tax=Algoriphagus sp. TaxID=1872435 RepID=UPI004047E208